MDMTSYRLKFLAKAHKDLRWGLFKNRIASGDYSTTQALCYPPNKKEWLYEIKSGKKNKFVGSYKDVLYILCKDSEDVKDDVNLIKKELDKTTDDINYSFKHKGNTVRVVDYTSPKRRPVESVRSYSSDADLKDIIDEREADMDLGVTDNGELIRRDKSKDKWTKIRLNYLEKEDNKIKDKIRKINA